MIIDLYREFYLGIVEVPSRAPKIRALKALVRDESSHVVFIVESKVRVARIDKMGQSIGFRNSHCVSIIELNF